MLDKPQVGRRIQTLRKKLGFSQAALSEKLNVSTQAVSKWETGQALPDIDMLLQLSWLFEISINSILEGGEAYVYSNALTRGKLPPAAENLLASKNERKLLASLTPFFGEAEVVQLAAQLAKGELDLTCTLTAKVGEKQKTVDVALPALTEQALRELAPDLATAAQVAMGGMDRALMRVVGLLRCPKCKGALTLQAEGEDVRLVCEQGHAHQVIDGVVDFGGREIPGELWSLYLKNYEHFLQEKAYWTNWNRERPEALDAIWREIEQRKPRVLLDIACGTGTGIQYHLDRIHWPCVVIFTDLSHRILKWDRQYFTEHFPQIDMVYLCCDCAHLPIVDHVVDGVTSWSGFESMQKKRMDGFAEAYRILKPGASAIYSLHVIAGHDNANSQKWISLLEKTPEWEDDGFKDKMLEPAEWQERCAQTGFSQTDVQAIHGEMPAPDTNTFPYENCMAQWMAECVCVSTK